MYKTAVIWLLFSCLVFLCSIDKGIMELRRDLKELKALPDTLANDTIIKL